ncbi:MAG: RluA family pseudouridine synthase [Oscillospiraceae bacterium]
MPDEIILQTDNMAVGERLDSWVTVNMPNFTRSVVQRMIEQGEILVCGKQVGKSYKIRQNDEISVLQSEPKEIDILPEDIPLDIVYEDEALLVINKPKGMVVHPAPGNYTGTLVNGLMAHCKDSLSGINGAIRPGIVHRIDKNTSGLLIVAKNDIAHSSLSVQLADHSFDRFYEAVVYGNLKEDTGTVDAPIGRHPVDRKRMAVTQKNSKCAVTHYTVLERFDGFTHVKLQLETGRTHQIRVHMAYIGHPVAGDDVYGPKKVITSLYGQCLHARALGFTHPITGERLYFESELPKYFTDFLTKLKK